MRSSRKTRLSTLSAWCSEGRMAKDTEKTQALHEHRRSLGLKFFQLMNNQMISREQIAACTISEV